MRGLERQRATGQNDQLAAGRVGRRMRQAAQGAQHDVRRCAGAARDQSLKVRRPSGAAHLRRPMGGGGKGRRFGQSRALLRGRPTVRLSARWSRSSQRKENLSWRARHRAILYFVFRQHDGNSY